MDGDGEPMCANQARARLGSGLQGDLRDCAKIMTLPHYPTPSWLTIPNVCYELRCRCSDKERTRKRSWADGGDADAFFGCTGRK